MYFARAIPIDGNPNQKKKKRVKNMQKARSKPATGSDEQSCRKEKERNGRFSVASDLVGTIATSCFRHTASVSRSDLLSDIGELILVAHGVIEELNATALGNGVQRVGGGDAMEVRAAACATGSGVRVANSSVA